MHVLPPISGRSTAVIALALLTFLSVFSACGPVAPYSSRHVETTTVTMHQRATLMPITLPSAMGRLPDHVRIEGGVAQPWASSAQGAQEAPAHDLPALVLNGRVTFAIGERSELGFGYAGGVGRGARLRPGFGPDKLLELPGQATVHARFRIAGGPDRALFLRVALSIASARLSRDVHTHVEGERTTIWWVEDPDRPGQPALPRRSRDHKVTSYSSSSNRQEILRDSAAALDLGLQGVWGLPRGFALVGGVRLTSAPVVVAYEQQQQTCVTTHDSFAPDDISLGPGCGPETMPALGRLDSRFIAGAWSGVTWRWRALRVAGAVGYTGDVGGGPALAAAQPWSGRLSMALML